MNTAVRFQVSPENGMCACVFINNVWSSEECSAGGVMSSGPQGNSGMAQAHWARKGGALMDFPTPFCMAPSFFVSAAVEEGQT